MPPAILVLFDDALAQAWEPFALTRPAGELLFGTRTLRARAEEVLELPCRAHLAAAHLRRFEEEGAPPVRSPDELPRDADRLLWLSRAVPAWRAREVWRDARREGPILIDEQVVGWFAPAGTELPGPGFLQDPSTDSGAARGEPTRLPGRVLRNVWELVSGNAEQISRDVAALHSGAGSARLPEGVLHWGDHPVILGEGVRLEPGCALDTTEGPLWLEQGVVVRAFTRLAGPAYVGPDSQVLGGTVECVSLGPVCKVRGELSTSICLGYTNKQHAGHMGHAYLGRWVNLGAETTNSDLKNNYGSIRIWTPGGDEDTGEVKLGSLLGDHVKTGIGLLLNTGTVVGAGSNLYGSDMPPKFVPPFSWGTGDQLMEYRLDKFLEVAEQAMSRRDVELSAGQREQLREAWERGRELWGT